MADISGISEIVLEVRDLDRAVEFYADKLGLPLFSRRDDRAWVLAGRSRIGLWRPQIGLAGGRGGVHVHYAFHIEESRFDALVARLEGIGLQPEVISFEDEDRGRAVYVNDPDGNVVEFWTHDVGLDAGVTCARRVRVDEHADDPADCTHAQLPSGPSA